MPILDYVQTARNKITLGAAAAIGLIITGVGVSNLLPATQVKNTSGVVTNQCNLDGSCSMSGALLVGSGALKNKILANGQTMFNGITYRFPYADGSASGRVLATNAAGQLTWTTGAGIAGGTAYTNTGGMLLTGDGRWVNVAGDTMTGALGIRTTAGAVNINAGVGLEVLATISGTSLNTAGGLVRIRRNANSRELSILSDSGSIERVLLQAYESGSKDAALLLVNATGGALTEFEALGGGGRLEMYDANEIKQVAWDASSGIYNWFRKAGTIAILRIDGALKRVGINQNAPETELDVLGTISGSALKINGTISGSGNLSIDGNLTASGIVVVKHGNSSGAVFEYDNATQSNRYQFFSPDGRRDIEIYSSRSAGLNEIGLTIFGSGSRADPTAGQMLLSVDDSGSADFDMFGEQSIEGKMNLSVGASTQVEIYTTIGQTANPFIIYNQAGQAVAQFTESGGLILNDFSDETAAADVRFESDTNANMFFLDASADAIGINNATPTVPLHVKGNMSGRTIFINASGAPSTALCRLASGAIGSCSSVVAVDGTCTCT